MIAGVHRAGGQGEGIRSRSGFAQGVGASPELHDPTARLEASSAGWLAERIAFAPGMAAMMAGLGQRGPAVTQRLVENLETRLGRGPIGLSGVAFIGTARVL